MVREGPTPTALALPRMRLTRTDLVTRLTSQFTNEIDLAGVATGEFRPELDARLAGSALFGMVATTALDWLVFDPARALEDIAASAESLVLHAVSA